ncbi:hypothetical protein ACFX13_024953 [Malus domestica]
MDERYNKFLYNCQCPYEDFTRELKCYHMEKFIVLDAISPIIRTVDKFRKDSFQKALNALAPLTDSAKKKDNGKRQKGLIMGKAAEEGDIFKMVKMIIQRQYDPMILFSFHYYIFLMVV